MRIVIKKHLSLIVVSCAAALFSSQALAGHCDADLANVQQRLSQPTRASANALEAAAALVEAAIPTCQYEAAELAVAPPDSPLLQPGYVTVGQSMLVNSLELIDTK
jgi:hypothetical protein